MRLLRLVRGPQALSTDISVRARYKFPQLYSLAFFSTHLTIPAMSAVTQTMRTQTAGMLWACCGGHAVECRYVCASHACKSRAPAPPRKAAEHSRFLRHVSCTILANMSPTGQTLLCKAVKGNSRKCYTGESHKLRKAALPGKMPTTRERRKVTTNRTPGKADQNLL